jgi:hypothetical protein
MAFRMNTYAKQGGRGTESLTQCLLPVRARLQPPGAWLVDLHADSYRAL